jgi:hypothetical protein
MASYRKWGLGLSWRFQPNFLHRPGIINSAQNYAYNDLLYDYFDINNDIRLRFFNVKIAYSKPFNSYGIHKKKKVRRLWKERIEI